MSEAGRERLRSQFLAIEIFLVIQFLLGMAVGQFVTGRRAAA
jgi:uncharacterized protein YneF (UPF0154 family)